MPTFVPISCTSAALLYRPTTLEPMYSEAAKEKERVAQRGQGLSGMRSPTNYPSLFTRDGLHSARVYSGGAGLDRAQELQWSG